ncbi:nuclear transport factor 2 family protein [Amaricoccus sp.]|uniref:nuclear transport factor 2 family protein n=1 Tax=Amaricoccus sp. TaxID=1872485 RepID=UPI0039E40108
MVTSTAAATNSSSGSARHRTIARSAHYLCNCTMDFQSDDRAVVETYFIARMRMGPEAGGHRAMLVDEGNDKAQSDLIVEVCGRYADRFERRDDEWRIARRITIFDFSESRPAPPAQDNQTWAHGVRGPADPLYRHYDPAS